MGNVKFIKLSQEQYAIVDEEDFERASARSWHAHKAPNTFYAISNIKVSATKRSSIKLHRLVVNAKPGESVDHINGDGLDCTKSNLRICRHEENSRNRKISKNNKSGYKGVSWCHRRGGRWISRIGVHGENKNRIYLGSFRSAIEAARAYDRAAKKYHGSFAKLNFLQGNK